MFDFNDKKTTREEILKSRENRKRTNVIMDMVSEIMLNSDAPESIKVHVRLVNAARDLETLVHEAITDCSLSDDDLHVENANKLLFLLITTQKQIEAFLQDNPLVVNTGENKDAQEN